MKILVTITLCFFFQLAHSLEITEKEVKTKVDEVTVYIKGAQVTRNQSVDLQKGKSILKFSNLSPFIDAKSIQVKANREVTVLSVNHQQNFIDKSEKPVELTNLESRLDSIEKKLILEETYLSILKNELAFLEENRSIGGKNQELSVTNLKEAEAFYSNKLTQLKLQEIKRNTSIKELTNQKSDLRNQIKIFTSKKEFATGEILVKVEAPEKTSAKFSVSYLVENAGWFPSYDIRAERIDQPLELVYKANVRQDTKVDWKNVKLRFSSSNPSISGTAPELKTYFLSYNTLPPIYNKSINTVSGRVFDTDHLPLPGTTITVKGTTIGTVADPEGNYSITIPSDADYLVYSFIGCKTQTLPIRSEHMNVTLEQDNVALNEVVAVGYGMVDNDITSKLQGRMPGVSLKKKPEIKIRGVSSIPIQSVQVRKQTSVNFEIKTPYTINSDNKSYTVDMTSNMIHADFQYYCVPKIDNDAFLLANIVDWERYNLLEGEANLFFEDTYVGKSLLNLQNATDTLQLSLGRDKNLSINREKVKDFTTRQFIGNKKEESRTWNITVKNNKDQQITISILDQVPVSTSQEINVEVEKQSGAKYNLTSGELKWKFSLSPNEKKELELQYTVSYPKNRNLIIE